MRVLYIVHSTIMGGATISFINMLLGEKEKGVDPIVIIPKEKNDDGRLTDILSHNNVTYYKANLTNSVIAKSRFQILATLIKFCVLIPLRKWRSRKEIAKIIDDVKPDIIHTNSGVVHEGFHLAKKYGIPHIWHLREYQVLDFGFYIYPSFRRFCSYLHNSYVITITDGIREYFNLLSSPLALTIYNGIFHKADAVFEIRKENYFFLSSRISPEKGHLDVIKAFGQFSRKADYKLIIAGEGDEKYINMLKAVAKEYNCDDRIEFIGFKSDVKPIMSKAKAVIVASYYEAFGRMTAESAFCGTIVIGRKTAGTKEILDLTGGLLFNSIAEMKEQMEFVSTLTEDDYNSRVLSSQTKAILHYSIENNVDSVYNLYKAIVK